jgi:hypothetical protein
MAKSDWNVCVAKPIPFGKRCFTQVGVGWNQPQGSIRFVVDVTLIISPNDELFLFKKGQPVEQD